jgi:hypothetical protein
MRREERGRKTESERGSQDAVTHTPAVVSGEKDFAKRIFPPIDCIERNRACTWRTGVGALVKARSWRHTAYACSNTHFGCVP